MIEAQALADLVGLCALVFTLGAGCGLGVSWFADRALWAAELRLEARRKAAGLTVTEYP